MTQVLSTHSRDNASPAAPVINPHSSSENYAYYATAHAFAGAIRERQVAKRYVAGKLAESVGGILCR